MDIFLFPFGGNAREAVPVIEAINIAKKTWNILGFIDDDPDVRGKEFAGYRVIGGREKLKEYPEAKVLAVPGRPENYSKRDEIINKLKISIDHYATLVHPSASIGKGTKIGYNTLIMAGVVTTANVNIGKHCVILPNTVISHDVIIDDYTLIGSNVSISGNVHIEKLCYVGTGAKLIHEITIKQGTLIGLGSAVLKSTEQNDVIIGNPGKLLRKAI